jgi:hypothetical protein
MVVEVKPNDIGVHAQTAIEQLRHIMTLLNCSTGFAVTGDRIVLLRDSLEKSNGESIYVAGEAKLLDSLLSSSTSELEFSLSVQRWFEKLKEPITLKSLPNDLQNLSSEPIISLLRLGEVRAARPRWSNVSK